jgi:hypothetical protein
MPRRARNRLDARQFPPSISPPPLRGELDAEKPDVCALPGDPDPIAPAKGRSAGTALLLDRELGAGDAHDVLHHLPDIEHILDLAGVMLISGRLRRRGDNDLLRPQRKLDGLAG